MKRIFNRFNFEAAAFSAGLLYLLIIDPSHSHFSFCLFKLAGIDFCPGCGLGRSVSYLLHLNAVESIKTHPLGIPALLIIVYRIVSLLRDNTVMSSTLKKNSGIAASNSMQHKKKEEKNGKRITVYAPAGRG